MSNGEPKSLLSKKAFFCYKIKQIVDKINMIGKEEAKLILNWEKWYKKRGIPSPFKRETMIEVERVLARSRENQGEELR